MTVIQRHIDLVFIKFPVFFPLIYLSFLFRFPEHEYVIAFLVIGFLGEPHFGATWTVFFDKKVRDYAAEKNSHFLYGCAVVALLTIMFFLFLQNIFYLLYFAFNVFHVTRQSVGIYSLFTKNEVEKKFQILVVYYCNMAVATAVVAYLMLGVINKNMAFNMGAAYLVLASIITVYQYKKYHNLENALTTLTGLIIFAPSFFVDKPLHAILAGVTMHYSQYLCITLKLYLAKKSNQVPLTKISFGSLITSKYFILIMTYAISATAITVLSSTKENVFSTLLLVPILGQVLHFYIDGLIWRFSVPEVRRLNLKPLIS